MTIDELFDRRPARARVAGFEARPDNCRWRSSSSAASWKSVHTIVEAGTGVGKSMAYLVPAMRSGKKVVLSTGTIALQEQLVDKDIPLVRCRARDCRCA